MAEFSFDVVSEFDTAELTNALDQARREVATRYDFKDTQTAYDHRGEVIVIESGSEERAKAALQVLREKAARRQLSPKLFKAGDPKTVGKGRGQIEVALNAGVYRPSNSFLVLGLAVDDLREGVVDTGPNRTADDQFLRPLLDASPVTDDLATVHALAVSDVGVERTLECAEHLVVTGAPAVSMYGGFA